MPNLLAVAHHHGVALYDLETGVWIPVVNSRCLLGFAAKNATVFYKREEMAFTEGRPITSDVTKHPLR